MLFIRAGLSCSSIKGKEVQPVFDLIIAEFYRKILAIRNTLTKNKYQL